MHVRQKVCQKMKKQKEKEKKENLFIFWCDGLLIKLVWLFLLHFLEYFKKRKRKIIFFSFASFSYLCDLFFAAAAAAAHFISLIVKFYKKKKEWAKMTNYEFIHRTRSPFLNRSTYKKWSWIEISGFFLILKSIGIREKENFEQLR